MKRNILRVRHLNLLLIMRISYQMPDSMMVYTYEFIETEKVQKSKTNSPRVGITTGIKCKGSSLSLLPTSTSISRPRTGALCSDLSCFTSPANGTVGVARGGCGPVKTRRTSSHQAVSCWELLSVGWEPLVSYNGSRREFVSDSSMHE